MAYSESAREPLIIQGGMGVAVSSWRLAKAVSVAGQLGVVSGTALDVVLVRRLQLGDPTGDVRRALAAFPFPAMAKRILDRYYIPEGKPNRQPFATTLALSTEPTTDQLELVVIANFVEVYLAKEDHDGLVGINYLEKIQTPTLPSLFGAILADVDYVLMGAGIPRAIPGIIDRLADGKSVELPLNVVGAMPDDKYAARFSPSDFTGGRIPFLRRPKFIAIVASATLASVLAKKASGSVEGFVVEGPTAGGHNAPPRGKSSLNARGEPVYGKRDEVDLTAISSLGKPFWLAGSYGSPEQLLAALESGATGIQVGTAFAFCEESGLRQDVKARVIEMCRGGDPDVVTDPLASPTGFPFKVLQIDDSLSEESVYAQRERICDLGFLRQAYRRDNGEIGWRCPGERENAYVQKGGALEDTVGRKCVCNGLLANVDLGQVRRNGDEEQMLVTCGNDVKSIVEYLPTPVATSYSASDVIDRLLSSVQMVAQGRQ